MINFLGSVIGMYYGNNRFGREVCLFMMVVFRFKYNFIMFKVRLVMVNWEFWFILVSKLF